MIDALQYLANAIAHRAVGDERRRIVSTRPATAPAARRRSSRSPAAAPSRPPRPAVRVELEPMSAVERRIVHEALKDDPEVDDGERGQRSRNRYVVVLPRRSVD